MILLKLFSLGIFLLGLSGSAYGTTCSSTVNRCANTLRVTSACSGSACVCTDASTYTAIPSGCALTAAIPKPTVTSGVYSGEVYFTSNNLPLMCTPASGYTPTASATYKWFVDTVADAEISATYTYIPAAAGENKNIQCQIMDGGLTSELSDNKNVKSYGDSATGPTSPPTITAESFTSWVTGSDATYKCVNLPKDSDSEYVWNDGSSTKDADAEIAPAVFNAGQLTCTVQLKTGTSRTAWTSNPTATVTLPASTATDTAVALLTGVQVTSTAATSPITIKQGTSLPLTCSALPSTVKYATGDLGSYSWQEDGTDIVSQTTASFNLNSLTTGASAKSITCKATPTGGTEKTSAPFSVTVSNDLVVPKVIVQPSPIVSGYMAIRCVVYAAALDDIEWSWSYDGNSIVGQTDYTLQINSIVDATHANGKIYTCKTASGLYVDQVSTNALTAVAVASYTPAVTSNKATTNYGTGNSYILTCATELSSVPNMAGIAFKWFKDGTEQSGQISQSLTITATTTSAAYTCKAVIGGTDSTASTPVTVVGKSVAQVTVTGLTSPMQGTSATLTCVATMGASAGSPTYVWKKGGTAMSGETSSTLTFSNVAATNDGAYVCEVTADSEAAVASTTFTVTSVTTPATPSVIIPTVTNLLGSYTLACISASADANTAATYEWKFTPTGGSETTLSVTSMTYQISSLASSNAGDYTCKVTISGTASSVSTAATLTAGSAFGKPCTSAAFNTECGDITKYTGNCLNQRCECATGVALSQDDCGSSGASAIIASVLMMCFSVLVSRLL